MRSPLRPQGEPPRGRVRGGRRTVLALVGIEALLAVGLLFGASNRQGAEEARGSNRILVATLDLTDLALWSGSSYGRHPSQTDLFAPFSIHPAAFDPTPAGSVIPAPEPGPARSGP